MSTNTLPLEFVVAALEPNRKYTPQQLAEAIAERLRAVTGQSFALFSSGSTAPSYDTGPWTKNGNTWYWFDTEVGEYVPMVIEQSSLKFFIGVTEPDPDVYLFWIELDGTGNPIHLKTYNGTAWVGAYYAKTELYTRDEIDAFFEPAVAGKMQIDYANVINTPASALYPARAEQSVAQNVLTNAVPVKLVIPTEIYDVGGAFDNAQSRYVAPVAGIYSFSWGCQVDNDTGDETTMSTFIYMTKGGVANQGGSGTSDKDPEGQRWFHNGTLDVVLGIGEYIEVWAMADDLAGTGAVNFSNLFFCAKLVQRT